MQINQRLNQVIDNLTKAVNVCYEVDNTSDDYEKTYPFATGYSKSAMNVAIQDLRIIMDYLNSDNYLTNNFGDE